MTEDKELAFGKVYGKVGSTSVNLILQTKGDVKIKTPNRYITIFKNGKLNVDDTSEIFEVSSKEEIKKTGIYLVDSTSDSGEDGQQVYLNIDGTKILLASSSDGYISYSAVQELKPEQFIQALTNIGLYFDTLSTAQNSGIQNGLVYTLDTGILYKVINGQFTPITEAVSDNDSSENSESTDDSQTTEIPNPLQIGGLLIDGNQMSVDGDELTFNIGGQNILSIRNGKIYVNNDVILNKAQTTSSEGAVKGESGYMLYTENDETWLEVDNLIVHNQSSQDSYTPQYFPLKIGSTVTNLITKAQWAETLQSSDNSADNNTSDKPADYSRIKLSLKYKNEFNVGDWVLIFLSGGNAFTVSEVNITSDEETTEDLGKTIAVQTRSNVQQDTVIEVKFQTENSTNKSISEYTQQVTIKAGSNYAEGAAFNSTEEELSEIISVKVISGDNDVYYESSDSPGVALPLEYYATVESVDPLIIKVKNQDNKSQSILANLAYSTIHRLSPTKTADTVITYYKNKITLQEVLDQMEFLPSKIHSRFGDLSDIYKDYRKIREGNETYSGFGIYSDNFVGVNPLLIGGTFTGVTGTEYPKYSDKLTIPDEITDDMAKVIPDIEMVKKLAENSSDELKKELSALQDNINKLTDRVALLEKKITKVFSVLSLDEAEIN